MDMLNKRRSGDDNIGKLIVFAITIVIAIGLVGLVSYFYTQSRQAAIVTWILGSTSSNAVEIDKLAALSTTDYFGPNCATSIQYDAIANTYALYSGSTLINAATGTSVTSCNVTTFRWVIASGSGYILWN